MNEPTTTLIGNLVADPELKFTPNGAAVANFTIAVTPKVKQNGEWVDGETLFARCSCWREMAEHVAESLTRGTRVIAQARIRSRSYETKEGEKRTVTEYEVDAIGPELRFANAKVTKAERGTASGGWSQQGQQQPQTDPWGASQGGNAHDEIPF